MPTNDDLRSLLVDWDLRDMLDGAASQVGIGDFLSPPLVVPASESPRTDASAVSDDLTLNKTKDTDADDEHMP